MYEWNIINSPSKYNFIIFSFIYHNFRDMLMPVLPMSPAMDPHNNFPRLFNGPSAYNHGYHHQESVFSGQWSFIPQNQTNKKDMNNVNSSF